VPSFATLFADVPAPVYRTARAWDDAAPERVRGSVVERWVGGARGVV